MARNCITYHNGKIFPCSTAAFIYRFNNYFGEKIPITKSDYSDIVNDPKNTILEVISNPIPLCSYCDVNNRIYGNNWDISRKKITEWTNGSFN